MARKHSDTSIRVRCNNIGENLAFTLVVAPNGNIYLTAGGNKSGQLNTTLDNTLFTIAAFIGANFDRFDIKLDSVLTRHYGDDVLCHKAYGKPLMDLYDELGMFYRLEYEGPFDGSCFTSHTLRQVDSGLTVGFIDPERAISGLYH